MSVNVFGISLHLTSLNYNTACASGQIKIYILSVINPVCQPFFIASLPFFQEAGLHVQCMGFALEKMLYLSKADIYQLGYAKCNRIM